MPEIQSYALIKRTLTQAVPDIEKALANRLGPQGGDLFVRCMLNTLQANDFLQRCTIKSLVAAALESASLGLQIDGVLGHAYVVPFRKKGDWIATFMPGYKGYLAKAAEAGCPIWAHVVHENDHWECDLGANRLSHRVIDYGDRGAPIGAYAAAKVNGQLVFEYVPHQEIERVKKMALDKAGKGAKSIAWSTNEAAMWRKTPIRRLYKFLPLPTTLIRMAEQDEQADTAPREVEAEVVDAEATSERDHVLKALDQVHTSEVGEMPKDTPNLKPGPGDTVVTTQDLPPRGQAQGEPDDSLPRNPESVTVDEQGTPIDRQAERDAGADEDPPDSFWDKEAATHE